MQTQRLPVLIFAQSGRFLAQSATQAGHSVWVADCFGDIDTLAIADRWQQLPSFNELTPSSILALLTEITQGEMCHLICGSGIEHCYHLLEHLPDNIHLLGNSSSTIQLIKTPSLFFALLAQLQLPYPNTQFSPPTDDHDWLVKDAKGLGGSHIQYLQTVQHSIDSVTEYYYQRRISGLSGSCLFLAGGQQTCVLSINKQYLSPTPQTPFRLGGIESPWAISIAHQKHLEQAIKKISISANLIGLNSLDFIISEQDELFILEINPRPSASSELIADKGFLFQQHIDACSGLLKNPNTSFKQTATSLFYHYAQTALCIPEKMLWPIECHDLPSAGIIIKQGEPICISLVICDENNIAADLHIAIEQKILRQIDNALLEKQWQQRHLVE